MAKKRKMDDERITVSVNGRKVLLKIGDHIKFNDGDVRRCVTQITVDSDGCVSYLLTFLNDNVLTSQWFTENDFRMMSLLQDNPKTIGFV